MPEPDPNQADSIHLVQRFRDGDDEAAEVLFERFTNRLLGLARQRISQQLGQRVDAEDVIQSVYRSFFSRAHDGQYHLNRSGDLWRLLAAITVHKIAGAAQHHRAQMRDMSREQCLDFYSTTKSMDVDQLAEDPSTLDALTVTDVLQQIMSSVRPADRRILELRLQGETIESISNELGCAERTVRRGLERLRTVFEERLLQSLD